MAEVSFTGQSGAVWRYWMDQPLGTPGFFGAVYAAEGSGGGPMAVKVVSKQHVGGVLDERLLLREVEIGRRVSESGADMLLPVVDAAETSDSLLLVMARADGPLADKANPLEESEVVAVMADLAAGLEQLHELGVIHRDLKPENVLRHEGRWKLADFGIARDREIGTQDPTFIGIGSYPYMAPELWELKSPTVKTDLYALGCLAFQLLSGRPPYPGNREAARAGHLTTPPPEAPASNTLLKNLIARLIAKDPGDRPQDARAVLERLNRVPSTLNPAQQLVASKLAVREARKSQQAAERATAKARTEKRRQLFAQACEDIREIVQDALNELQAIDPDARYRERFPAEIPIPYNRADNNLSIFLIEADTTLCIDIWDIEKSWPYPFHAPESTAAAAAVVLPKSGSRSGHYGNDRTISNLFYDEVDKRFAWQVYSFKNEETGSEQSALEVSLNIKKRFSVSSVRRFTSEVVLELFGKAIEDRERYHDRFGGRST
jgi:serine/threonine protein kinase